MATEKDLHDRIADYMDEITDEDISFLLIPATGHSDAEAVQYLLGLGLDINLQDKYGTFPLSVACARQDMEMVELLLKNKANPNAEDPEGHTPLHWTRVTKNKDIEKLLKEYGATK